MSKQFHINPALRKAIIDIRAKDPKSDEDKVVEKAKQYKINGLSETAIRAGVKAHFIQHPISKTNQNNNKIGVNPQTAIEVAQLEAIQKLKKKTKKNQFLIEFQDSPLYKFQNLGGIQEVYSKIETELFNLIKKEQQLKALSQLPPNRGFLIGGSPGSGKTILANCILSYLSKYEAKKIAAYSVTAYDFLGGDAEEKFKKLFEAAEENAPSVVFIDNIQQLSNKENNKRMQSLPSLTLSSYIDKCKDKQIYFLGASSAAEKLDQLTKPGTFYKQIKINNPDEGQRKQILQKLLTFYKNNVENDMKELTLLTAGYVAVDFTSLMKEAALRCVQRTSQSMQVEGQEKTITIEDFRNAIREVQPVLKKDGFAKIPNVKMQDVGALQNIKEQLTQEIIMPLKEQQKFKNMNFQVSGGGILLYGPPGCGKTMIAKAIANEANANFITVKGPQLLTKYVGESEEAVRKVFDRARMSAPCIIFFDEFDALAPKRQDQGNQVTERVVNTLLNELNGVDDRRMVFVIAATNRPDIIDEAVLRSGRIQKHLYVPLPNTRERLQILEKITRKVNRQEELELQDIANRTQNFSGADLYFLVKKSIISAISQSRPKIQAKDLKNALQTYKQDKYNKGNRLRLSQFQGEQSSDKEESILPGPEEGSTSIKKARSVMEVEQVNKPKPKQKHHDSILESFMEYLLEHKKRQKELK